MTPQTYIFIGRSGCGKGTQAELLKKHLLDTTKKSIFYMETGARFREFIERDGVTPERARAVMKSGDRQPDFLAIWMWAHFFVGLSELDQHWILDGTPRSLYEAEILDGGLQFYGRPKPRIVHIAVSREWSKERLTARKRADDIRPEDIEKRMNWFDHDVLPAVEFFKTNKGCDFFEINGEQPITNVWQELLSKITTLG